MTTSKFFKKIFFFLLLVITILTIIESCRNTKYQTFPKNPPYPLSTHEDIIYFNLLSNKSVDWDSLNPTLEFIKNEYDISDFKLVNLIRILYDFEDSIPHKTKIKIDSILLGFRYWMDEPSENSMCYWSENHQILFSSAEYLISKKYLNRLFFNSKELGKEHMAKAKNRILDWLEMRWLHGFSEFYSATYYIEDIAALINLVDYADDNEIISKSKIILDLLFYDIATQQFKGKFSSVSGRAYKDNRRGENAELGGAVSFLLGEKNIHHGLLNGLYTTRYKVPAILKEIALDTTNLIIKQRNGLNISDLKKWHYNKNDQKSIMMQWGMEAFVNPATIRNTMHTVRKYNMFTNEFLKDLKFFNYTIIHFLRLEPLLSKWLNLPQQGKAIQQANTYTYKTNNYSLYTVQKYFPGSFADQHHVSGMNIGNSFSIFHTHPAREKNEEVHSPNYWVGYGRLPHVMQDENISIALYNLPFRKNIFEKELLNYTYAYFPEKKFDSTFIFKNYAFGKKANTYCALIAKNKLTYKDSSREELIQQGEKTFWIIEAGSKNKDGSFSQFYKKVLNNSIHFNAKKMNIIYHSNSKCYELQYNNFFKINNSEIKFQYQRFESKYIHSFDKNQINLFYNNLTLILDFYKCLQNEKSEKFFNIN